MCIYKRFYSYKDDSQENLGIITAEECKKSVRLTWFAQKHLCLSSLRVNGVINGSVVWLILLIISIVRPPLQSVAKVLEALYLILA